MSEAYAGKSNQQIIDEQEASLNSKSASQTGDNFHSRNTVLSEQQDGVNESGVEGFPGAEVHVGRTGQTGGGTNPQWLSEAEGGASGTGEMSSRFEGAGGPEDKRREALAQNPGGYDAAPRGIDEVPDRSKKEPVPMTEGQQLEPDQEGTARGTSINS